MKKKLLAFLTALTCMASASALPAAAQYNYVAEYYAVSDTGGLYYAVTHQNDALLIETDGTELTEAMFEDMEGYLEFLTYREYLGFYAGVDRVPSITPEGTAYVLRFNKTSIDQPLVNIGRSLALTLECATNIQVVDLTTYQRAYSSNYLDITTSSPDVFLNVEDCPELAGFTLYVDYVDGKPSCYRSASAETELLISLREQGLNDWEIHQYFCSVADTLLEKYSDTLLEVDTHISVLESPSNECSYSASSIWDTAGDHNADGTVNAQDGADILQLAAELGTGASTAISSASDVNADGTVDAQDSAAVLTFAAASGSGSPMTWVEILR